MNRKRNSEKLEPQEQPIEPEMQKKPDEAEHIATRRPSRPKRSGATISR
jgi:hypothetical protein